MKKKKLFKKGTSIVLTFAMILGIMPTLSKPIMANAQTDVKTISLGTTAITDPTEYGLSSTSWSGDYVYFGNYNGSAVKYRVLDSSTTEFGGNTMLLDCDSVLENMKFDSASNVWSSSDLKTHLNGNFLNSSFTDKEKNAVAVSTKPISSADDGFVDMKYAALTGEKIFVLDAAEATRKYYGYSYGTDADANRVKKNSSGEDVKWCLRSAQNIGTQFAAVVLEDGSFGCYNVANCAYGVSPAFNLDLSSVLFTSSLSQVENSSSKEWALTLKDTSKSVELASGQSVERSGNTITVPYKYTGSDVSQISVMITDKAYTEADAAILYYGKLEGTLQEEGSGTFIFPSGLSSTAKVYILAEDVNDDITASLTDYSSAPVEITVPASKGTGTQEDPYIIGTAQDLSDLAASVKEGNSHSNKYFKLTNDITYSSTPIGCFSENKGVLLPFCGNFDGQGHTVTLAMTNENSGMDQAVALFGYLGSGASVKNIVTTGTITSSGKFSGGIAGVARDGAVSISNCCSNVKMDCTVGDDCTYGGILGLINNNGNVTIQNCCFTGDIYTSNGTTLCGIGGLCGWSSDQIHAENCYVDANFYINNSTIIPSGKYTGRQGQSYNGIYINCYYNSDKKLTEDSSPSSNGTPLVTGDFSSGKAAWLLQNGQSVQAWGQQLTGDTKDSTPVLTLNPVKAVYKVGYYNSNEELENMAVYVNTNKKIILPQVSGLTLAPGYDIIGWYKENDTTNLMEAGSEQLITSDTKYYLALDKKEALWHKITYKIGSIDAESQKNSGDEITGLSPNEYYEGETCNLPADANIKDYTLEGWYKDKACTEGNKVTQIAANSEDLDLVLYGKFNKIQYVCSLIMPNGDTTNYTDFHKALDAFYNGASENSTLKLLSNVTYDWSAYIYSLHTLDLNGYKLDIEGNYMYINEDCTFTIRDSGTGGILTSSNDTIRIQGKLTIESGTVETTGDGCFAIISEGDKSDVTIIDGTFIGKRMDAAFSTGKKMEIRGGDFTHKGLQADSDGVTLKGGKFSYIQAPDGRSVSDLLAEGYCYYDANGKIYTPSTDCPRIISQTVTVGKMPVAAEVTKGDTVISAYTLQEAFDLIGSGETGTVKLLEDIDLGENDVHQTGGSTVTFDLNGHTVKHSKYGGSAIQIYSKDITKLTIKSSIDGGTLLESGISSCAIENINGEVTVESGVIANTGVDGKAIRNSAKFTLMGGILDTSKDGFSILNEDPGTIEIIGGIVKNGYEAILNRGKTVSINGGTILGNTAIDNWKDHTVDYIKGIILGDCKGEGTYTEGNPQWSVRGDAILSINAEIPSDKIFMIPKDAVLNIGTDATLTNNGTLLLNGTLSGAGTLSGTGEFKTAIFTADDIQVILDQTYTGSAIEPAVTINSKTIMGKEFTADTSGYTKSYENNTNVGTAKVIFTNITNETDKIEKSFNIVKSGTTFEGGIKTYNGETQATNFTYGDSITVKVAPKATGTAPAASGLKMPSSFSPLTANQMALFVGENQITEPVNETDGVYTMTCDTKAKDLVIGENTITAKYVGTSNMADYSESVTVTLNKKAITSAVINTSDISASKEYDGTNSFSLVALSLEGVESGDIVTAKADGTVESSDAGTGKTFTASATCMNGKDAGYYSLDSSAVSGNVTITQATVTGVNQELQVVKELEKEYIFDLTKMLPKLSEGKNFRDINYTVENVTDNDDILGKMPADNDIKDGKITLNVKNVADKDKTAVIQIKVASKNYKDFTADLNVKTIDKTPLTIEAAFTGGTYNGKSYVYTGTPTFKKDTETMQDIIYKAKYAGRDGTIYDESETAPINAGKYNLIITVSGESTNTYAGTITIGFEITKKQITAKPNDVSLESNASFPSYTWSIETGIEGEEITETNTESVAMEAQENGVKLQTVKVGTFDIVFTTEPVFNQNGDTEKNYDIQIGKGKLTVTKHEAEGGSSSTVSYHENYVSDSAITETSTEVIVDLTKGTTKLSSSQMDYLINQNKDKTVVMKGEDYTITFEKGTMKQVDGKTDFGFGVNFNSGKNYNRINELSKGNLGLMISCKYSGVLPAEASIRINVGIKYAGQMLNYYYYNQAKDRLEFMQSVIADDKGFVTVKQSNCFDYALISTGIAVAKDDVLPRIGGADRYETSVLISKAGWISADTVVLARSDNYADALAGTTLAYKLDAPILLTDTHKLNEKTSAEIKRLGAKKAVLLGGTGAISKEVEKSLVDMGITVERINGNDRFETSALIAEKVFPKGAETAVVVYGMNFPDALSISSYAAAKGMPILLTDTNTIPKETLDAIKKLNIKKTIVIGGRGIISEDVFNKLPNANRIWGDNRYGTCMEVASYFKLNTKKVYIATGLEFADAISGAILAAKQNTGILLVDGKQVNESILLNQLNKLIQDNGITELTILGGSGAVNILHDRHD